MALQKKIANLEDVDEHFRDFYQEHEGAFVLKSELEKTAALAAEREKTRSAMTEAEQFRERLKALEDIDPEEFRRGREALEKVESERERELLKAGKFEDVVAMRMAQANAQHARDLAAKDKAIAELQKQGKIYRDELSIHTIDHKFEQALTESELMPRDGALHDLRQRARAVWTVNDKGETVPMENGSVMYGKDGISPITWDEYVVKLAEQAGHLFVPASGGGAGGSDDTPAPGVRIIDNDPVTLGKNLEAVAKGKTRVRMDI